MKSETGRYLEMFVKSAQNFLNYDAKVRYLRSDQGNEYTGGYTMEVLQKLGAEQQLASPDTPKHNDMSERFHPTLQNKIRTYMFDAKLPEHLWDLVMNAAVYAYNRTSRGSNEMITPLQKFSPNHNYDINQIKRLGCLAYIKVNRKVRFEFKAEGQRIILIGYTPTGYQFIKPDNGKFYKSSNVRFNEKLVYGDKYEKNAIAHMPSVTEKLNDSKLFVVCLSC